MIDQKMFSGLTGILKRTIEVLELCLEISGKDYVDSKIMNLILSVAREEQNRLRGGRGDDGQPVVMLTLKELRESLAEVKKRLKNVRR